MYAQAKSRVQLRSGAHKMQMHAWCQVVMSRQALAFLLARELLISLMARLSEQCVGHSLGGSTTRLQGCSQRSKEAPIWGQIVHRLIHKWKQK